MPAYSQRRHAVLQAVPQAHVVRPLPSTALSPFHPPVNVGKLSADCREVGLLSDFNVGTARHEGQQPTICGMTYNATLSPNCSALSRAETINQGSYPLLKLGEGTASLPELVSQVAQLRAQFLKLHFRGSGRRPFYDVCPSPSLRYNAPLLLKQSDRSLRCVQRDPVLRHQLSVGGQSRPDRVLTRLDLAAEQVCHASAGRTSVRFLTRLVIHPASVPLS